MSLVNSVFTNVPDIFLLIIVIAITYIACDSWVIQIMLAMFSLWIIKLSISKISTQDDAILLFFFFANILYAFGNIVNWVDEERKRKNENRGT